MVYLNKGQLFILIHNWSHSSHNFHVSALLKGYYVLQRSLGDFVAHKSFLGVFATHKSFLGVFVAQHVLGDFVAHNPDFTLAALRNRTFVQFVANIS